ncbi:MAG: hypothetical protein OXQ86_06105 [Gammaproteobacteria bacterium]|nr:hypothetical protein [Gammaproteobacteria bacterium]MDE0413672.1 hypothetical protein [Gammaproteobacteria bacterium]
MSDALTEMLWMGGCTVLMACVGLIAFVGYLRAKPVVRNVGASESSADTEH